MNGAARVVGAFEVVEDIGANFISGGYTLRAVHSVFSVETKLSIADLVMISQTSGVPITRSQTSPVLLIEHVTPLPARGR